MDSESEDLLREFISTSRGIQSLVKNIPGHQCTVKAWSEIDQRISDSIDVPATTWNSFDDLGVSISRLRMGLTNALRDGCGPIPEDCIRDALVLVSMPLLTEDEFEDAISPPTEEFNGEVAVTHSKVLRMMGGHERFDSDALRISVLDLCMDPMSAEREHEVYLST